MASYPDNFSNSFLPLLGHSIGNDWATFSCESMFLGGLRGLLDESLANVNLTRVSSPLPVWLIARKLVKLMGLSSKAFRT